MSIYICATTPDGSWLAYDKPVHAQRDPKQHPTFMSCKVVSLLPALLIPVRTNTWKNFSKDFFFPTTTHHATRIKGVVKSILAVLGALLLDIFTLPIRLFTALPRHLYIISHPHPFYKEIQSELQKTMTEMPVEEAIRKLKDTRKKFQNATHVHLEMRWQAFNGNIIKVNEDQPDTVVDGDDRTIRLVQQPHGISLKIKML